MMLKLKEALEQEAVKKYNEELQEIHNDYLEKFKDHLEEIEH